MKTKKIIVAGALVREVVYSRAAARETPQVRQAKRRVSSEAQQLANAKYSWEKLELMIAANFVPGDLVVTLTFDDEHLPESRAATAARLKKFRSEFGRIRRERGQTLTMIWSIEHRSGEGRWHVHLVCNTTGDDYRDILRCWPYGRDIDIRQLRVDKEKNYESLARYMTKEARERSGLRSWSYTRNCRHPEVETFPVPDDTALTAPEGATVIQEASKRTEYAEYHYIKYLASTPVQLRRLRPRSRRKR